MAVRKRAAAHRGRKKAAPKRRVAKRAVHARGKAAAHKGRKKAAPKRKTARKVAARRGGAKRKVARHGGGRKKIHARGRGRKAIKEEEALGAVVHKRGGKKRHAKSSMMEYMHGWGPILEILETPKKGARRGTKKTGARARRSKKR